VARRGRTAGTPELAGVAKQRGQIAAPRPRRHVPAEEETAGAAETEHGEHEE
jgi:hypothetical protein